jgi:DNA-binding response OmpR family regulator
MKGSKSRVLVVDDNELNRDVLRRQLEREGYEVVTAAEGLGALALIDSQSFDLLLLDIMMPGLTGIELLKIVRAAHPAHELPVIMATARDTSEDRVEALSLGANDYFTKPIDYPALLARMQSHLETKSALQNERSGVSAPRSRGREQG